MCSIPFWGLVRADLLRECGAMTLQDGLRTSGPVEVDFSARVSSMPRYFFGTHTRCEHEEFRAQTSCGPIDIIDNVDIAPRVPVSVGDQIEVRGELVRDPGKMPIVHWTHHDPGHKHADGFIRFAGRVYG